MKRILFALSLLVPINVSAVDILLPDGCYVAFNNPNFCYAPPGGNTLNWTQGQDQSVLSPRYGVAVATIISRGAELDAEKQLCENDLGTLTNDYNGLVDDYNSLLGSLNKLKKRLKKLKKKLRGR